MKRTITIEAFSDNHNLPFQEFKGADVLTFVGDMTNCAPDDILEMVSQFLTFMERLEKQAHKFKHIIIIWGNHDVFAEKKPRHNLIYDFKMKFKRDYNVDLYFLINELITIDDFKFYGNPYTSPISEGSPWAFHWTEKRERKTFNTLEQIKPDVMLTHSPPRGILDKNWNGLENGDLRWNNWLRHTPMIHIFGHIHEGYGYARRGDTDYYNVAQAPRLNTDKERTDSILITLEKEVENE